MPNPQQPETRYRALTAVVLTLLLTAVSGCVTVRESARPEASADAGTSSRPSSAAGRTPNEVATAAAQDVERFWTGAYPALSDGAAFVPVRGGYHPYTRTSLPPACGDQRTAYQPNAFYCPDGDFIAWDAQTLIPQLQQQFGPLLVGVVLAHEYGHAVQTRLALGDQPTVVLEQQADCFAGAWTADVLAGHSPAFRGVTPAQLDNTVAGLLQLRDQPGTPAQAPEAHGNAFDRIRALQDGVQKGAATCAAYRAGTLPVTEVPFTSRQDAANGGDLPYAEAVSSLADDAQEYWSRAYPQLTGAPWRDLRVEPFTGTPPACPAPDPAAGGSAFYCTSGDFVTFDNGRLGPQLYRNIGDNAVGMLLGDLFARAAQDRRGQSTSTRSGQLTVDCLAGSWTHEQLQRQPGQGLTLSPGDLDEAVAALLAFGRASEQTGTGAFDRIASYRDGVLRGLDSCS
ncbi:neutral zinc metallopeptidase [Actinoplanes awajinensis]|uniref:Zinc metallopeptidase n=1 Tax=Actinoplanes awajinensis subsp. mycoplanecinus TaxID=135947 RepID=A0A0X3VBL4_9ACTN|nr:neutral zinc metallopeptidase [Actinoplanes awajinensis]KUL41652.1 zinc metallopeptidase [Actinoplanes awajinensis subsp. mycoplanecinus]